MVASTDPFEQETPLDLPGRGHCSGVLASYKHPRRLVLVGEIPRTPATGQIQRRLLLERVR